MNSSTPKSRPMTKEEAMPTQIVDYEDSRVEETPAETASSEINKFHLLTPSGSKQASCGINLDNKEPTTSLNEYIVEYNNKTNKRLKKLTHEKYFAMVFNEIENLYDIIQNDDVEVFYDLYYKHWIHLNSKIKIQTEDAQAQNATVLGIDDFGFLKVRLESGEITVVQPDGNSFDMIKGLIAPKPKFRN